MTHSIQHNLVLPPCEVHVSTLASRPREVRPSLASLTGFSTISSSIHPHRTSPSIGRAIAFQSRSSLLPKRAHSSRRPFPRWKTSSPAHSPAATCAGAGGSPARPSGSPQDGSSYQEAAEGQLLQEPTQRNTARAISRRIEEAGGFEAVLSAAAKKLQEEANRHGGWDKLARVKLTEQEDSIRQLVQEVDYKGLAGRALTAAVAVVKLLWRLAPTPLKWPLATFTLFYAWVILAFGSPVARDLTPLWIIGPLLLSYSIWQVQQIAEITPVVISSGTQLALKGISEGKQFLAYAQSGRLLSDTSGAASNLVTRVSSKQKEAIGLISSRREALVTYVGQGQLEKDSKEILAARAKEASFTAREWALQRAEDFSDWFFIFRRRLAKLLAKVF